QDNPWRMSWSCKVDIGSDDSELFCHDRTASFLNHDGGGILFNIGYFSQYRCVAFLLYLILVLDGIFEEMDEVNNADGDEQSQQKGDSHNKYLLWAYDTDAPGFFNVSGIGYSGGEGNGGLFSFLEKQKVK